MTHEAILQDVENRPTLEAPGGWGDRKANQFNVNTRRGRKKFGKKKKNRLRETLNLLTSAGYSSCKKEAGTDILSTLIKTASSPNAMDQQESPCCHNFMTIT